MRCTSRRSHYITIYCPVCGMRREVTRRIRKKTCADCRKEEERKERQSILANKLVLMLKDQGMPVIYTNVMRVLEAQHEYKKGVATQQQRERAGT